MKRPPGLLRKNENPDVLLMIGTAGLYVMPNIPIIGN